MPTTYAHYRFGCSALEQMPEGEKNIVMSHRALFDFGVHGPDLLFYYKPFRKECVNQLGYRCHERTGLDFFSQAAETVRNAPEQGAALSYLFGVLCHFALDRECHPYVGRKEKTGVSHSAIEASFDRCLMEKDGLEPVTHRVTRHLLPSRESAAVIAPFYAPLTADEVFRAEKSMVFYLNLLVARGLKRSALLTVMKLAGQEAMGDMFIPLTPDPRCRDSDEILCGRYGDALALYPGLQKELAGLLAGTGSLGPGFDHTFGET